MFYYFFDPTIDAMANLNDPKALASLLDVWGDPPVLDWRGSLSQGHPTGYIAAGELMRMEPVARYFYSWIPNLGEFIRFTRRSDHHETIAPNETMVGHIPDHYIPIEKYLPTSISFPTVTPAVEWIMRNNRSRPPFYSGMQHLRQPSLAQHFQDNGTVISLHKDSFPWNGLEGYPFTVHQDGIVLELLRSVELTTVVQPRVCLSEGEVLAAINDFRLVRLSNR
jgi:hypothetical protein